MASAGKRNRLGRTSKSFGSGSTDEELIEIAQRGNLEAYNVLVARHGRAVFNLCYRMLGSRAEAEDAAQDTFFKAWQAVGSFKAGVVRPWIMRIATNRCYDRIRSMARRPEDSLSEEEDAPERALPDLDDANRPEFLAEQNELSHILQRALDGLPPDQRIAVILCDIQRFSYDDAAAISGVPAGTLKSRASRGRERLRQVLREDPASRELLHDFGRFPNE